MDSLLSVASMGFLPSKAPPHFPILCKSISPPVVATGTLYYNANNYANMYANIMHIILYTDAIKPYMHI